MDNYSDAYHHLKKQIIDAKNGQIVVTSHGTLNEETARAIFRAGLHEIVRTEYLHDHGLTEEEHEILHGLVEGQVPPEGLDA